MHIIKCEACGDEAVAQRSTKRFCSRRCWPARLPHTNAQRDAQRERSRRYYDNLSQERKTAKWRRDAERAKAAGWPHSGINKWLPKLVQLHGNYCGLCGLPNPNSVDHIRLKSKGGSDELCNLVPAHGSCNSSKWNRDFIGWAVKQGVPMTVNRSNLV